MNFQIRIDNFSVKYVFKMNSHYLRDDERVVELEDELLDE